METVYRLAADLVVLIHFLWIVFLVFGAVPGVRWPWVKWTHLGALAFSVALQLFGWVCPITHLEVWLRRASGTAPYAGTFIGHYLERLVYAPLPPYAVFLGTLVVIAVSLWAYFGRRRRT